MKKEQSNIWTPGIPVEENIYNWKGKAFLQESIENVSTENLTLVDLFCGCGGFSTGFEMVGFNTILGLDIHPPSIETFKINHKYASTIVGDIRSVPDELILEALDGKNVDVVTAGVPCQGFSISNRKRWKDDKRNLLFREFIRVVRLLKPKVVLLENVTGLQSTANGEFKRAISDAIEETGYYDDFNVLNAADFGVPQKRQRVFFMGVRKDLNIKPRWPKATHGNTLPQKHITVWEAIGDLPQIESNQESDSYDKPPFSEYQKLMRNDCKILLNHIAPKHPLDVIEKIGQTIPGQPMYPKFKQRIRLHPNKPSPTQICGGIRPQFQFGHPTLARGLTIRERCRIQSFPDHYFIAGGTVQGRVQTGNAVPPLLAKAIAQAIQSILLNEHNYESEVSQQTIQLALFAKY
ncbi:MAG: DNA cytosine methyltransferase [Acidobacteria bacterium]|nr:DNA cytosine methyltransferase [Acidobacteriota bacterium]